MPKQKHALQEGNKGENDSSDEVTSSASCSLDDEEEIVENSNLERVPLCDIPCDTDTQSPEVVENYSFPQQKYSASEIELSKAFIKLMLENQVTRNTPQSIISFTDHFEEINSLISSKFPRREDSVWVHYNPLTSKYLEGPSCGIVALSMASQMFNEVDASKILLEAVDKKYTRMGEMFDAEKLAEFASNCLQCEAKVISNLSSLKFDMLSHICDGWPVLIPYDFDPSDPNPGMYAGKNVHWAVLNGVGFRLGWTVHAKRGLRLISTSAGQRIKERLLYDCRQSNPDIFVFARESMRKEISIWQLDCLLKSNNNLMVCDMNIFIPLNIKLQNLRDKAVLLKKN